jgi:hypothetical protein
MTSHVKCDRSCRRACAPLFVHTLATSGSVAGEWPVATVIAMDQGGPSAVRLARSMKAEDKDSPDGGRPKGLSGGRPPLPSGEEPSASPLAGRR